MRTLLRRGFFVGLLAAAAYAVWRFVSERSPKSGLDWEAQPFPSPPRPVPVPDGHHVTVPPHVDVEGGPEIEDEPATPAGVTPWMEPVDGVCPESHPVKAKLGSGIYHLPGSALYDRTVPDRCYLDAAAAEADGLRASKR
jgi:hypothetical protein